MPTLLMQCPAAGIEIALFRPEAVLVRDSEIEAKQTDDGADQPLGLAQSQAEHCPQGQRGCDR
jgi:hypothetical protein